MKRKLTLSGFLLLFFVMIFSVHGLAASWVTSGTAVYSNGVCTLTESEYKAAGMLAYSAPLDTRNGFTISFDYWVGDYKDGPRDGFMLVFADNEVAAGSYGTTLGYDNYIYGKDSFYGIAFRTYRDKGIAAVKNNGTSINYTTLASNSSVSIGDSTWHHVVVTYRNRTVTVTQDGAQVLSCSGFNVSDKAYFGISAATYLWAFGCQKHVVKNISLQSEEASLVYLNANGGTTDTASLYVLRNSSGSLPAPTRTGYTFAGWYTEASGGAKINGMNYNFAGTSTVYAHWTANSYTVKLDANGGSCSTSSKTVSYDSAYGSLPAPKRTGYTFSGWYTAASSGSLITSTTKVGTASGHTLYARWTAKSYKVKFNATKGTLKKSRQTRTVQYGQKVGSLPTPTRKNYTFLGWYTKKSGGKKISSGTVITKKTTYYARWVSNSKKVTIKLKANGGSCSKSTLTVTYGGKLTGLPTPTRSGYTFDGWYTAKTGGTKVKASTKTTKVLTKKTLYAHWTKKSSDSPSSPDPFSKADCWYCGGSGICPTCGGSGVVYKYMAGIIGLQRFTCTDCYLPGKCRICGGSGKQ